MQQTQINPVNELIGRIRINENKLTNLRERLLVTDTNMISEYKKMMQEIKTLNLEIRELKKEIFNIKETFRDIIKETQNFAKKTDLKVLEKYINLWNPLNFVTSKEVEKIIKEKLKKKNASK